MKNYALLTLIAATVAAAVHFAFQEGRSGTAGFYLVMAGPQIAALPDHGLAKEKALAALMLQRL